MSAGIVGSEKEHEWTRKTEGLGIDAAGGMKTNVRKDK